MADRLTYRAVLADDEPLARASLRALLRLHDGWVVAEEAGSGLAVLDCVARTIPHVLFLDVRMPGLDGLTAARRLGQLGTATLVVFVTAYSQHAVDAFEVEAVDYLVKPIEADRFARTMQRLEAILARQAAGQAADLAAPPAVSPAANLQPQWTAQLVVRSATRTRFVSVNDLVWIASDGNYARLYLPTQCILHRATLSALEAELDPGHFIRIQRGAIVNRRAIVEVRTPAAGRHLVVLADGSEIDISQRYAARVLARLGVRSPRSSG